MFSRFSRRQFISVISLSIAGATIASSFPFLKNFVISKAQAQETSEEVYKGRKYKIIINSELQRSAVVDNMFDASTQLFIDGKEIRIHQHKKTKKYLTPILFGSYESPKKIAETLIDLNLKFPDKEVEIDPNID
ncbi:hypothetical protein WKK05_30745 [Nostoc sp. UHCC 0302]|uniref:hypothetical protein n=1 Tax=Nostoc sp. UHCC 0302 TaxID=3134896 RepID=UPI00311CA05F